MTTFEAEVRTLTNETAEISELIGLDLQLSTIKDALFLDLVDEKGVFIEKLLEFATPDQVDHYLKGMHYIGENAGVLVF